MKHRNLISLPVILFVLSVSILTFFLFVLDVRAQIVNGIYEPEAGAVISGIVIVSGTADDPNFLRYELAFRRSFLSGSDWIVFAQGDQPVIDETLAIWDTTVGGVNSPVFPDGNYQLRLRVVRTDYNYDEFFVRDLIIANLSQTPTATATLTGTLPTTLESPVQSTSIAATLNAVPNILPTLTPFPTPSLEPGPAEVSTGADQGEISTAESPGLLEQLRSIRIERFGRAFWIGVVAVAIAFGAMSFYLLFRAFIRWGRRRLRNLSK